MITLFKKVRKQSITKSKFSKYLVYSVGEIFLIVIGILIAVYINNRNEKKNLAKQEFEILLNLKEEFKGNLILARKATTEIKATRIRQKNLLNFIDSDSLNTSSTQTYFSKFAGALGNTIDVDYEDGRLQELLYSGRLRLISNDSLRSTLGGWENTIKDLKDQLKLLEHSHLETMNLIAENGNIKQLLQHIPGDSGLTYTKINDDVTLNSKVFASNEFQNKLTLLFFGGIGLSVDVMPKYTSKLKETIFLLEKEIKKSQDNI